MLLRDPPEPQSNQRGIERSGGIKGYFKWWVPQSNQRGIERHIPYLSMPTCHTSLNRTSVGLKASAQISKTATVPPPQSNQRGIESSKGLEGFEILSVASIEPAWD